MNEKSLKFTIAETRHLLNLLYAGEQEGTYYGNREQYWTRHYKIMKELQEAAQ